MIGTSFRTFPSFPQRYIERLATQLPAEPDAAGVRIEPMRAPQQPTHYTQDDLHIRQFLKNVSRRLVRKGRFGQLRFRLRLNSVQLSRAPR